MSKSYYIFLTILCYISYTSTSLQTQTDLTKAIIFCTHIIIVMAITTRCGWLSRRMRDIVSHFNWSKMGLKHEVQLLKWRQHMQYHIKVDVYVFPLHEIVTLKKYLCRAYLPWRFSSSLFEIHAFNYISLIS